MAKRIFDKHSFKLTTFLLSVLVSVSFTMSPVHGKSDSDKDKIDKATARVSRHMEKMKQKCPRINEKKKQVEEKLKNGTMSPHEACSRCHTK